MTPRIHMTRVLVIDLDASLAFYERLGFAVKDDLPLGRMRWLTLTGSDSGHELLLAAVDQHLPPIDQAATAELLVKGAFVVLVAVDDVDETFAVAVEAGAEVLQEPIDQPYGMRDCAVRDPSGNQVRLSRSLA